MATTSNIIHKLASTITLSFGEFKTLIPPIPRVIVAANLGIILLVVGIKIISYCASAGTTHFLLALRGKKICFVDNVRVSIGSEFGANILPLAGGPIASYVGFRNLGVDKDTARYAVDLETTFLITNYVVWYLISLALPPYPRLITAMPDYASKFLFGIVSIAVIGF